MEERKEMNRQSNKERLEAYLKALADLAKNR